MPDLTAPLKLGADIWNQYTDWPAFKAAHLRAEELGYESLWTMDHIYPPNKPSDGPIGYHHLVFYWPAPYDEETMVRMVNEVRPRLEALISR
jgi:alkanesulfonate monooxygenase SsuD/methylene tetrahydromethanopterin reductase-like flavin-dependent oxidoreductase (luciferase family)